MSQLPPELADSLPVDAQGPVGELAKLIGCPIVQTSGGTSLSDTGIAKTVADKLKSTIEHISTG